MIGGKKVIGICMTKIQDPPRSRMVAALNEKAAEAGYKMMVFNSPFDFASGLEEEIGAAGIYDIIHYDVIDVLIILCSGFLDKSVCEKIIERALQNKVPVILEDMEHEGCYTVKNKFEEALEELLNHVIRDHGVRDTFFIAGQKDNEYSDRRVDVYKKVLADNQLEFHEDMLDYGGFWSRPTNEVMDRLFARKKPLPKAILCANDAMGVAVCKKLQEHGIRVPEDVLVTGFDGSRSGEFSTPRMSTCAINTKGFAGKCISLIHNVFNNISTETVHNNYYMVRRAESCGCSSNESTEFKKMAREYHRMLVNTIGHEYVTYNDITYLLNSAAMDANMFYGVLFKILDGDSVLALRPSWLSNALGEDATALSGDDELVLMEHAQQSGTAGQVKFPTSDIIPRKEQWAEGNSLYVINSLQIGKMNCGYYECVTTNIIEDATKINRVLNLINITIHMAASDLRQRYHKISKGENALIDSVTELANLHGLTKWYEEYASAPAHQGNPLTVSVYVMPKYRYIYEKYGIQAVGSAECFVAEALKIANPGNAFVAHISNDEFVVVNYYDDVSGIADRIHGATSVFYSILERYNQTNGQNYYVEVNAGCAEIPSFEGQKLEVMIQMATSELYRNKVLYGAPTPADKPQIVTSKEKYDLFNALISKNLFQYHFQPIVSAVDGEILAYEALMRTEIGFNPLEILNIATEYQRLYDVEKATLFNVMARYVGEEETFKGRKVFINCIPGHFLNEEDRKQIGLKYARHMNNFVFEITERDTITERELEEIRTLGNGIEANSVAIDDYGTGHSNIVNLIKYAPEVVKLDRFLMTDIHKDASKQMLVKSTIEFAKMRGIKVLAEGIETKEELCKVIELGVDYIQGYFTGRPALNPIEEIDAEVKEIIRTASEQKTGPIYLE